MIQNQSNNHLIKMMPLSKAFSNRWFNAALSFFLLAAILGTSMRYFFLRETPSLLDYRHILHAHSHVALLGWAFMLASGGLMFLVLKQVKSEKPYFRIFILNIISALGMVVTFLIQGYGPFSIAFSVLHIFTAYLFAYYFLKDYSTHSQTPASSFIKWSIYWMLVSTVGIWTLAPIIMLLGKGSAMFYNAVQFFLHFQFNGWFTYALLGLWIHQLHQNGEEVTISPRIFWLLQLSLLLTYALSITWSNPLSVLFYMNSLGVIFQAIAFYVILKEIFKVQNPFTHRGHWTDWLLMLGIICLAAKALIHLAVAIPAIAEISYTIRNYVIGFIHLIMLGSVTFTIGAILIKRTLLPVNKIFKVGWILLGIGFLLKEFVLFGQGTLLWMKKGFVPYYYEIIFGVTAILPTALIIMLIGYNTRTDENKLLN